MKISGFILLICVSSLSACSTLGRPVGAQGFVAKFDRGAHTVSSSEMAFLHQVQAAGCTRDFYEQAFKFATAQDSKLDLAPQCTHQELTDHELQQRQKLLSAITLYADSLLALKNGANDTDLNRNSSSLARSIASLASKQGFTAVSASGTGALNAAVVSIAEFIIDHHADTEITVAASKLQEPLATIVDTLKSENLNDAHGLLSKFGAIKNEFRIAVLSSRKERGVASFLNIAAAHAALNSILIPPPHIAKLNSALDALVAANQALADPRSGAATLEISALVSRGRQAVALFHSSR